MMTNQPAATINTYYLIPITYYLNNHLQILIHNPIGGGFFI